MRAAMHALGCGGDAVVPTLLEKGITHESPLVTCRAAEALGEAAVSYNEDVIQGLCELAARSEAEIGVRPRPPVPLPLPPSPLPKPPKPNRQQDDSIDRRKAPMAWC